MKIESIQVLQEGTHPFVEGPNVSCCYMALMPYL